MEFLFVYCIVFTSLEDAAEASLAHFLQERLEVVDGGHHQVKVQVGVDGDRG